MKTLYIVVLLVSVSLLGYKNYEKQQEIAAIHANEAQARDLAAARKAETEKAKPADAVEQKLKAVTAERDAAVHAKSVAVVERDEATRREGASLLERDEARRQKDAAILEKDEAAMQRDVALRERDNARQQFLTAQAEIGRLTHTTPKPADWFADKLKESSGKLGAPGVSTSKVRPVSNNPSR